MPNPADLLADLRRRGVVATPAGGDLRILAPRGILTPGDRVALRTGKAEIMAILEEEYNAIYIFLLNNGLGPGGAPDPHPAAAGPRSPGTPPAEGCPPPVAQFAQFAQFPGGPPSRRVRPGSGPGGSWPGDTPPWS